MTIQLMIDWLAVHRNELLKCQNIMISVLMCTTSDTGQLQIKYPPLNPIPLCFTPSSIHSTIVSKPYTTVVIL